MMIGLFLVWGVVIVGAVLLVRGVFNNTAAPARQADLTPREILARRYARGEISKAEYDRMLSDLS
jgi:putative membrane protein